MAASNDPTVFTASWEPWGPFGFCWETDTGFLATSYTDGADTRWTGRLTMGPEFNSISLAVAGETTANANAIVIIPEAASATTWHVYVARGNQLGDILGSTLAQTKAATAPAALGERCTGLLVTKAATGAVELTEAMANTNYRVRTVIAAAGGTDTVSSAGATKLTIVGQGDDRVVGLQGQYAYGNILTGTTTMIAPSWQQIGRFDGNITPTGFCMNRGIVMWGTNLGVLMLNALRNRFENTLANLAPDSNVARAMRYVPGLGALVPMKTSLRSWELLTTQTVGVERWGGNESPIKGQVMGIGYDDRWTVMAIKNPITGDTYFVAARPRIADEHHSNPVSYFCIGKQSTACEVVECLGTIGSTQTQPIWMVGDGSNVKYFKAGLMDRWIDDTGYRFSTTTQTWYGTELRRYADEDKRVDVVDFEGLNLSSTKTLGFGFNTVDARGNTVDTGVLGTFNTSGRIHWEIPVSQRPVGRRIQPYIVLTNGSNTSCPQVIGEVDYTMKRIGSTYGQ